MIGSRTKRANMSSSSHGSARYKDDAVAGLYMSEESIRLAKGIQDFIDGLRRGIKETNRMTKRWKALTQAHKLARIHRMYFIMQHPTVPIIVLQMYFPMTKSEISNMMTGHRLPQMFQEPWQKLKKELENER